MVLLSFSDININFWIIRGCELNANLSPAVATAPRTSWSSWSTWLTPWASWCCWTASTATPPRTPRTAWTALTAPTPASSTLRPAGSTPCGAAASSTTPSTVLPSTDPASCSALYTCWIEDAVKNLNQIMYICSSTSISPVSILLFNSLYYFIHFSYNS